MDTKRPNKDEIFNAAAELAGVQERSAYVRHACGEDLALRAEIEELLKHDIAEDSLLDRSAPGIGATIDQPLAEKPGTQIGPYKLLQQIGEGGMGTVYMAEQTQPVQRKVALKVIKRGMDSRQIIARFEAERQALAMMDHVNIARVLDAGATESGRPYFVMELINGVPITKYCDDNRLTPRQRLELFVPVCQAIQHAHQKGIIHRDIKPSNVMVTLYDGKPVPKVIDFGVAKATEQKLTERTLFTQYGTMVGTLEYMSPEQAEMSALGVDTRSDIYSLGVLLYELLTGSTPLSSKRMKEAAYAEILRLIKEEEPPKPSTRLSDSGEALASISANRHTEPAKLTQLVKGELDWIVMKTLEKDRNRRYETANGFAMDVQRYLADEPVQACPPSAAYLFRKFARRNKRALGMAVVLGVALLLVVGSLGWTVRDRAARQSHIRAQVELILGEVDQLEKELKWPEALVAAQRAEALTAGGADADTQERIDWALEALQMVATLEEVRLREARLQPGAKLRLDEGHPRLYAAAFRDFGADVERLSAEESAARLRARPATANALAAALDDWARTARPQNPDQSKRLWALAAAVDPDPWRVKVRQASAAMDVKSLLELASAPDTIRQPLQSQLLLASSLRLCDRPEQALALLERASEIHPGDFWIHFSLGWHNRTIHPARFEAAVRHCIAARALRPRSIGTWVNLGLAYHEQGKLGEALACWTKAVELDPKSAVAYSNLGVALHTQNKTDEAIAACRKAIQLEPAYAPAHNNLGVLLLAQKKLDPAISASRKAIDLDPELAGAYRNLGTALRDQNKLDEAVAAYRKAIELEPQHVLVYLHLGHLLRYQGKLEEAIACYNNVLHRYPKLATVNYNIGLTRHRQKKLPEAIDAFRKEIELNPKFPGVYAALGEALRDNRDLEGAIDAYRKVVELDPKQPSGYGHLGYVLAIKKDFEGAIAAYRAAAELNPRSVWVQKNLGDVLRETGDTAGAVVAYRAVIGLDPSDAQAHWCLGNVLIDKDDVAGAIREYTEVVRLNNDHGAAHDRLAWLLTTRAEKALRDSQRALASAQRAVELEPMNGNWQTTLGMALYYNGDWKDALAAFDQAQELRSEESGEKLFFLAMAHWRLSNRDEARQWRDKAIALGANKEASNSALLRRLQMEMEALMTEVPEVKNVEKIPD